MTEKPALLFVDDEAPLLTLVAGALEDEGFDVVKARSGAQALDILQSGHTFDFIVSDVSMPDGVSGVDLAQRARELQPHVRIILASGHPKAQLDGLPADAAFLAKPYRIGQLLDLLAPPG
jgi:CheY-like chemotaxis protein